MIGLMDELDGKVLEVKGELKAFGGSTANVTEGPDGIAPLSKQSAFKKAEPALVAEEIESLDLGTASTPSAETPDEEKIPISVADPSGLSGFSMPKIDIPAFEETPTEPEEPQAKDIPMPKMDEEVLGQEPQGVNESLFASSGTPTPTPTEETAKEDAMDDPVLINPLLGDTGATAEQTQAEEKQAMEDIPLSVEEEPEPEAEPEVEAKTELVSTEVEATPTNTVEEESKNYLDNSVDKEEMSKYVEGLVNEYNEELKNKFGEILNDASKNFMSKLVEVPVFLGKKEPEQVAEATTDMGAHIVDEEPELESIPSLGETEAPALNPTPAPTEMQESGASAETLEAIPSLETALESVPALEALGTQLGETPASEAPAAAEEPAQEETVGGSVFPPASHDNLVEDAYTQINKIQEPTNSGLDNSQIQGGKFL